MRECHIVHKIERSPRNTVTAAIRLASVIWLVAAYHNIHWYNANWPTVLYSLVAIYLFFDDDAKRYFRRA